jgi:YkoY family integral membrane protein
VEPESTVQIFTLPNIGMVFQLAIIEGLLSFDNALALAAMVSSRHRHPLDRKRALLWGIWGAYITRVLIVFIGVWLMAHEWVKFMAGGYLLWMAVNELFLKKRDAADLNPLVHAAEQAQAKAAGTEPKRSSWQSLWKTILAVELMDLMFSIDSIAVALAVSNKKWVLIAGAIVGILMMRVAASYFIRLIEKFPILVDTAFVLVGVAGVKVMIEIKQLEFGSFSMPLLGIHVPETFFLPTMLSILIGAILYNLRYPERFRKSEH